MSLKIAIIKNGYVPHYRLRFFELINQGPGVDYVVIHGAPPPEAGSRPAEGPFEFPNIWVKNREIRFGKWTLVYQPIIRLVLSGRYDAVVLGDEVKFIANLALSLLCRMRGVPVLFWGFGYHRRTRAGTGARSDGPVGAFTAFLKSALVRRADG